MKALGSASCGLAGPARKKRSMGTPAQNYANFENALDSTGPKSAAGKARSRFNAVKHGLSKVVLTDRWSFYEVDNRAARLLGGPAGNIELLEAARRLVEAQMYRERVEVVKDEVLKAARQERNNLVAKVRECVKLGAIPPELVKPAEALLGETGAEWEARILSDLSPGVYRADRRWRSLLKTALRRFEALTGEKSRAESRETNPKKPLRINDRLCGLAKRSSGQATAISSCGGKPRGAQDA